MLSDAVARDARVGDVKNVELINQDQLDLISQSCPLSSPSEQGSIGSSNAKWK